VSGKHLIALGDSHLEVLEFAAELNILNIETSNFSIVPGATVIGLRNPNSLTDAINIFKSKLISQPLNSYILIQLGEVDCGFVMWWRAKKYSESIENQFKESIKAYSSFVNYLLKFGFHKICITGASLPTIRDGLDMGEVANKRSEINISIKDRTDLTMRYNFALERLAGSLDLHYFDITNAILDRSKNTVHEFYRNTDIFDHHLDKAKTVGIWASKCNDFLNT